MTVLNGAINGCEELVTTYFKEFQERNIKILSDVESELSHIAQTNTSNTDHILEETPHQNLDEELKKLALYSDTSKYLKNLGIHSEFARQQAELHSAVNGPFEKLAKQQAKISKLVNKNSYPSNVDIESEESEGKRSKDK